MLSLITKNNISKYGREFFFKIKDLIFLNSHVDDNNNPIKHGKCFTVVKKIRNEVCIFEIKVDKKGHKPLHSL